MCQSSGKVIIVFCMYVWCGYMRVHVWVCVGACPHVCIGLDVRCLSPVHIEVLPLTWVQSPLVQLVRCQLAPVISCLCILSTGIISNLPGQADIDMGAGDLNSSPHLCTKVFTDWIISPAACKKKKSFLFKKKKPNLEGSLFRDKKSFMQAYVGAVFKRGFMYHFEENFWNISQAKRTGDLIIVCGRFWGKALRRRAFPVEVFDGKAWLKIDSPF